MNFLNLKTFLGIDQYPLELGNFFKVVIKFKDDFG